MFDNKFAEASSWLQQALKLSKTRGMPADLPRVFHVLLGLAALRQGEIENCLEYVGSSSCVFALEPGRSAPPAGWLTRGSQAVHGLPEGGTR